MHNFDGDVILDLRKRKNGGGDNVFDKALFMYHVMRKNTSLGAISTMLEINPSTLTRKMSGESDFTREEVQRIRNFLELSLLDADKIFFAEKLA